MRSDVDLGGILLLLDLARLDELLLLGTNLLKENGCGLVVRILRNKFAAHREVKDGRL